MNEDLLIANISGVQSFIDASRTTADLWASSTLYDELSRAAVGAAAAIDGVEVIMPATVGGGGSTNRVVALTPAGMGSTVAVAIADCVRDYWTSQIAAVVDLETRYSDRLAPQVDWVSVAGAERTYQEAWDEAQDALVALKRHRSFEPLASQDVVLCTSSAMLPAVRPKKGARVRLRENEALSAPHLMKRLRSFSTATPFPSTASIAASPLRLELLKQLTDNVDGDLCTAWRALARRIDQVRDLLDQAPPGFNTDPSRVDGAYLTGSGWQASEFFQGDGQPSSQLEDLARSGRSEAQQLVAASGQRLTPYLGLLAMDGDSLGMRLRPDHDATADVHRSIGSAVAGVSASLPGVIASEFGHEAVPVYSGGDDLLAFSSAPSLVRTYDLARATAMQGLSHSLPELTFSAALVWFHRSYPLAEALTRLREALREAKRARGSKNAVSLVALRRGGERAAVVLPNEASGIGSSAALVESVAVMFNRSESLGRRVTGDLVSSLEQLESLSHSQQRAEVARLLARHLPRDADAHASAEQLLAFGSVGKAVGMLEVASFLASEVLV